MAEFRLFRPEAITFQRDPLRSVEPLPASPRAAPLTCLLAAMVCASLMSYALICLIAMGSRSVWRVEIP